MNSYLESLRGAELNAALAAAEGRSGMILEIGAADGFLASQLAARFGAVEAVDIEPATELRHPVRRYDGVHLPFADAAFDLVFSSHVMEHVRHFDELQVEIRRVLKPDGLAVHVVPTATWRLWTSLAHYPALIAFAFGRKVGGASAKQLRQRPVRQIVQRIIAARRHGESGTMLSELWTFRQAAWRARFRAAGWHVLGAHSSRLFYTGYMLFGSRLPLSARNRIARLFGSSSVVVLLAPLR